MGIVVSSGTSGRSPSFSEHWIKAVVYAFLSEILGEIPVRDDLEREVIASLAVNGQLSAAPFKDWFRKSIDSHKDLEKADAVLRNNK